MTIPLRLMQSTMFMEKVSCEIESSTTRKSPTADTAPARFDNTNKCFPLRCKLKDRDLSLHCHHHRNHNHASHQTPSPAPHNPPLTPNHPPISRFISLLPPYPCPFLSCTASKLLSPEDLSPTAPPNPSFSPVPCWPCVIPPTPPVSLSVCPYRMFSMLRSVRAAAAWAPSGVLEGSVVVWGWPSWPPDFLCGSLRPRSPSYLRLVAVLVSVFCRIRVRVS